MRSGDRPIEIEGDVVFVTLSVPVVSQVDDEAGGADAVQAGSDEQRWREPFFSGMETAEPLYSAMDSGSLFFDTESVCEAGGSGVVCYGEGVDVVKIDRIYLRRARQSHRGVDFLRNLVVLVRGAGASVVIANVKNKEDVEAAELAGATHIQGA